MLARDRSADRRSFRFLRMAARPRADRGAVPRRAATCRCRCRPRANAAPTGDGSVALRYQVRRGPVTHAARHRLHAARLGHRGDEDGVDASRWTTASCRSDLRERARGAHGRPGLPLAGGERRDHQHRPSRVEKTADVRIAPGPHASDRQIVFTGWRGAERARAAGRARGKAAPTRRRGATRRPPWPRVEALYRRRGFLAAKVDGRLRSCSTAGTARLPIAIDEGPRYVVSRDRRSRRRGRSPLATVQRWLGWRVGDAVQPRRSRRGREADRSGLRGRRLSRRAAPR